MSKARNAFDRVRPFFSGFSLNWVAYVLIAAPVLLALFYVYTYGVNLAWEDQLLSLTPLFHKWYAGTLTLGDFWQQHNEHRYFLSRLIMFMLGLATRWNTRMEMFATQLTLLGSLAILIYAFRRQCKGKGGLWAVAPIAWILFNLRQHQTFLNGFDLGLAMCGAAAIATLFLLSRLGGAKRPGWMFAAALLAGTLGTISSAAGLLLWIVGLLPLAFVPRPRTRQIRFASLWCLVGVVEWAVYFIGYHSTIHPVPVVQERTMTACLEFFLAVIGCSIVNLMPLTIFSGVLILAFVVVTVFQLAKRRQWAENSFWLSLIVFGLMTQSQVTFARVPFGLDVAGSSRYATFSLFVVLGVYGALSGFYLEHGRRFISTMWGAFLAMIVLGVGTSIVIGFKEAKDSNQIQNYQAFVFLTSDTQPDSALQFASWWKNADEIRRNLALLKEHRLNIFGSAELARRYGATDVCLPELPSQAHVNTQLSAIDRSTATVTAKGFALDPTGSDVVGGVLIKIDGVPYDAYYGLSRPDVVQTQRNNRVEYCGFFRVFPARLFGPGKHSLEVEILTKDRSAFFSPGPPVSFEIAAPDKTGEK
jgi:hypothetical protein